MASQNQVTVRVQALPAVVLAGLLVAPAIQPFVGIPTSLYIAGAFALIMLQLFSIAVAGLKYPERFAQRCLLPTALFAIFILWLMLSSSWTTSTSQYRADMVLLLGWLSILAALALTSGPAFCASFARSFGVFAGALAVMVLWDSWLNRTGAGGYGRAVAENYLGVAHVVGAATVYFAARLIVGRQYRVAPHFLLVCVALGLSLARGALLIALSMITLLGLAQIARARPKEMLRATVIVVGAVGIVVGLALSVERTRTRLARLLDIGTELVEGGRGATWTEALNSIADHPLIGYGLGSSGLKSAGIDGLHPHNGLLQVWLDGGAIGLLLFIVLASYPFLLWVRLRRMARRVNQCPDRKEEYRRSLIDFYAFFAAYVFVFVDLLKSFNLYGTRLFPALWFLTVITALFTQNQVSRVARSGKVEPRHVTISGLTYAAKR